jgi:hypothetical protein
MERGWIIKKPRGKVRYRILNVNDHNIKVENLRTGKHQYFPLFDNFTVDDEAITIKPFKDMKIHHMDMERKIVKEKVKLYKQVGRSPVFGNWKDKLINFGWGLLGLSK